MKKTYFIKTFNLIQNLFTLAICEVIVNLLLHILNHIIGKDSTTNFTLLIQIEKISVFLSSWLNSTEVFTLTFLTLLLAFVFCMKVKDDSVLSIFKSIWQTYRLRHFMTQSERTKNT